MCDFEMNQNYLVSDAVFIDCVKCSQVRLNYRLSDGTTKPASRIERI